MDINNLSVEEKVALLQQLKEQNIEAEFRKIGEAKLAELEKQKKSDIAKIESDHEDAVAAIKKQYGLSSKKAGVNPTTTSDKRSGKKPVLYHDPANVKNKWTGQGMTPKWLTPMIQNWGITSKQFKDLSIDDFTILEQVKQYHIDLSRNE